MKIEELKKAKFTMDRLIASAIYEFELATNFGARVNGVVVDHRAPDGTKEELIVASASITLLRMKVDL